MNGRQLWSGGVVSFQNTPWILFYENSWRSTTKVEGLPSERQPSLKVGQNILSGQSVVWTTTQHPRAFCSLCIGFAENHCGHAAGRGMICVKCERSSRLFLRPTDVGRCCRHNPGTLPQERPKQNAHHPLPTFPSQILSHWQSPNCFLSLLPKSRHHSAPATPIYFLGPFWTNFVRQWSLFYTAWLENPWGNTKFTFMTPTPGGQRSSKAIPMQISSVVTWYWSWLFVTKWTKAADIMKEWRMCPKKNMFTVKTYLGLRASCVDRGSTRLEQLVWDSVTFF